MLATPEIEGSVAAISRMVDLFAGRVWLVSIRIRCEELSLTHFVDDHPEVHTATHGLVEHLYFFGPQADPVPGYGVHARDLADTEALIRASLAARTGLSEQNRRGSECAVHNVQADPAEVRVLEGTGNGSDDGEAQPHVDLDG